uniref:NADH-ubiquinone oxidoreductase chain 5 n=1 Tax=Tsukubamonas globosa TaxID=875863 RepID=W8VKJ1_9EUKA|nr:NADH dehydrogenase subunit 5 [Tsukubamonas globosa]BAO51976.1 NADH dehydrogenase subunit 5 [Tsukubamonas globosa]
MYLNIILLPLYSFLTVSLFGSKLGNKGSIFLTTFFMFFSMVFSFFMFYEIALHQSVCYVSMFDWVISDLFELTWGLQFDTLTVSMLVLVNTVSFLVHLYSADYMNGDPHHARFMSYLSLFYFFMIVLVSGDNLIQLFVGWEGVGLCSYLLINFWNSRMQANKAAIKAMIMNRIGDLGLCIGLFLLFLITGSLDFASIFPVAYYWSDLTVNFLGIDANVYSAICLFFCLGVMGKSAQLGLHTWLPDAMEGPTPVSALIHAATMVTAGVFLVLRCSYLFELTSTGLLFLTFLGGFTAFFAATIGVFQNDLKKVIAYSTCSQLGYMVFASGLSMYQVSFFHLFNHGFFKALLFLSAGAIIHAVQDEQDMRKMGGLLQLLPFSYSMIMIGSLSLMGVPFLTGFYSKDLVLEVAYSSYVVSGHFVFWLGAISACLTSFYSIRLVFLTFYTKPNGFKVYYEHTHESPIYMAIPLMTLAIASIYLGYLGKDLFVGPGVQSWGASIFRAPYSADLMDAEFIPTGIKLLPVVFSLCGGFISFLLYKFFMQVAMSLFIGDSTISVIAQRVYRFFNQKWLFDVFYNQAGAIPLLLFGGRTSFVLLDKGYIEFFGPYGLIKLVSSLSKTMSRLQTGWIHHSLFILLGGVLLLLLCSFLPLVESHSILNIIDFIQYVVIIFITFVFVSFF